MNSYERKRRICKMIVLVLGILSINNIILTIRNYSYAYFEKNVKTGVKLKITTLDEMPSKGEIATTVIKNTLGTNGGVIGVTNSNAEVKTVSSNIREYRYSGLDVNNYIYFGCSKGTTYKNASSNCEKWRIIGVFKNENGIENLKIVKNTVYGFESWDNTEPYSNDWASSEINNHFNNYYNGLSTNAKDMVETIKYYLGTVGYGPSGDNTKTAYAHEREIANCVNNTGSSATATGCRVWSGNKATWMGNIALLYPSDYGFSASSSYWNTALYSYDAEAKDTSWLQQSYHPSGIYEFLLSPPSNDSTQIIRWDGTGALISDRTYNSYGGVRPCLYLKSEVLITNGDGSESQPYFLKLG